MPATRLITAWGETKSLTAWTNDRRAVVGITTICRRLTEGWQPEDAIASLRQPPKGRVPPRFIPERHPRKRPRVCLDPWQVSFIHANAKRLTVEEICERIHAAARTVVTYCAEQNLHPPTVSKHTQKH